ncbi:MAG TPA: EAL domain-containing protein [Pseudolabrys sp.]|nr:EAL domain-containing protein [Pseudolabrys sp.]
MSRLRDLSIKAKLSAGFGLSLVVIFAIGAVSIAQVWALNRLVTEVAEDWVPQIAMIGNIKRAMDEHHLLALRRINTTNFRQLAADTARMQAARAAFESEVNRYVALAKSPEDPHELVLLGRLREEWGAYEKSLDAAFARIDAGDPVGAQTEFDTTTAAAFAGASQAIDNLVNLSKVESISNAEHLRAIFTVSLAVTIIALGLAAAGVSAAVRWISKSVSQPILQISNAMQRLSAGDNSVTVSEGLDRKDEIGVLAKATKGYAESLSRIRELARAAALDSQRFDAALTNMAQGLSMFDAAHRLVIVNRRFFEIFNLPSDAVRPGMPIEKFMAIARAADRDPAGALAKQDRLLEQPSGGTAITYLADGRCISIVQRPTTDGGLVATFEDVTEQHRAEERINYLARFDVLTDLPNRASFYERLGDVLSHLRHNDSVAVLSLDLDHFKNVNDTLGHPIGDVLLKLAAERMRGCVRGEDIVARLGGDEFAIVQVTSIDSPKAAALASRLIEDVGAPYELEGHQIVVGVSAGIALAPADGGEPDVLMKNADLALYRAKADGGGTYRFFEKEMDARMQARRALELDLRRAVLQHEFELYYQPIVDVKTGRITGCEALIRWHHSERGMVPPAEFIPVAEETGLIVPIGEWVLRTACAEAARWPREVTIAVNLSPVQFRSRNLVQTVTDALRASGLTPGRLELEITELVLLQESDGAFVVLHQLRDLGIRIAMDDFGTGYSSLGYLRSFPFDKIKIDKSFIHDLSSKEDSVAIVRAVVGLSSSLGITTTAEGVETRDQLTRLASEGCNEVQGFLFSPPRPAREVERMLSDLIAQPAGVA